MARKVILDVDPGISDAVAMCLALFDPRLEVVAINAVGGSVTPDVATRNVQAVIEQLDPPRWPRIGTAGDGERTSDEPPADLYGADGLVHAGFVLRSRCTKTLIPLDVTRQVSLDLSLLDKLPDESTRAGRFLRRVMPYAFRAQRERLGLESIYLHEAVALTAVAHPELFHTERMAGDVETSGELTTGATVLDRRSNPQWRPNMDVAISTEPAAVIDYIIRGLSGSGEAG